MSYCAQGHLFSFQDFFAEGDDNNRLVLVLSALKDDELIGKLEVERKGRRDHYPVRMLWQSLVAAKVYGISTVNGLIRELMRKCGAKMLYAGRDGKYLKFRCSRYMEPLGCPCTTSSYGRVLKIAISENERRWPGLHRESKKFKRLYKRRTSVERVNSRLKEHLCLDQQHVRGLAKTTVNVGLSLLAMVGGALAMARNKKPDNLRRIVALAA